MQRLRTGRWLTGLRMIVAVLAFNMMTGCASGGYMVTRGLAKWLNSQNIVLRVVLYLLIGPVFVLTLLADDVIFNTVDFWSGKVSAKNDVIEKDGTRIELAHSRTPLRKSVITIYAKTGDRSVIELRETPVGSIEVYKDGLKRTEVQDIESALPTLVAFQGDGRSPASSRVLDLDALRDIETLSVSEGYPKLVAQLGWNGNEERTQLACLK